MILSYHSVHFISKTNYYITQYTVIHIYTPFPHNLSRIDSKSISLLDMVVKKSCKQVICRCDRMKISGKMKIQIFHRYNLCITATGSTTFNSKARSERWLAQSDQSFFTELCHCLSKSNGNRRLPLSRRSRIDCSNKYQLSIWSVFYSFHQFIR